MPLEYPLNNIGLMKGHEMNYVSNDFLTQPQIEVIYHHH